MASSTSSSTAVEQMARALEHYSAASSTRAPEDPQRGRVAQNRSCNDGIMHRGMTSSWRSARSYGGRHLICQVRGLLNTAARGASCSTGNAAAPRMQFGRGPNGAGAEHCASAATPRMRLHGHEPIGAAPSLRSLTTRGAWSTWRCSRHCACRMCC